MTPTIFFQLYFKSSVLPNDSGRRRTDDITNDDGVIPLVELLRSRRIFEGDLFCKWDKNMSSVKLNPTVRKSPQWPTMKTVQQRDGFVLCSSLYCFRTALLQSSGVIIHCQHKCMYLRRKCVQRYQTPHKKGKILWSLILSKVLMSTGRHTHRRRRVVEVTSFKRQGNERDFWRVAAHCVSEPLLSSQRATIDVYYWRCFLFLSFFFFFFTVICIL